MSNSPSKEKDYRKELVQWREFVRQAVERSDERRQLLDAGCPVRDSVDPDAFVAFLERYVSTEPFSPERDLMRLEIALHVSAPHVKGMPSPGTYSTWNRYLFLRIEYAESAHG